MHADAAMELPGPAILDLYLALDAIDRIPDARPNEVLRAEVLRFARIAPSAFARLAEQPLVLWRYIATPNYELLRFLELAGAARRPPLILEMPHDRFTPSINQSKRCLGKLPVRVSPDLGSACAMRSVRIVDFDTSDRRRFTDVRCFNGTPLQAFHHHLCERLIGPGFLQHVINAPVFEGEPPGSYYERLFALFTCFGALADNFMLEGSERDFTEKVIIPAFQATVRRFGAGPVIVRLLPEGSQADRYWDSYPAETLPFALAAARRCTSD